MKRLIGILAMGAMLTLLATGCDSNKDAAAATTQTQTQSSENSQSNSIKDYAKELKDSADKLKEYMDDGYTKGYIDQERLDEYTALCTRLDEIINKPEDTDDVKNELNTIKETLAVMASQCAAPNDVVDMFNAVESMTVAETEAETKAESEKSKSADNEDKIDFEKLSDDFTLLLNDASQAVDKGEVSEDDYTSLIEAGTSLAEIKADIEKNGENDDTNARLKKCKKEIHGVAVSMGSPLADKFK